MRSGIRVQPERLVKPCHRLRLPSLLRQGRRVGPAKLGVPGLDLQCRLELLFRFGRLPLQRQEPPEVGVGLGVGRVEFERRQQMRFRFVVVLLAGENPAEVGMG